METPAGWYDDGSGRQRWWDGRQWTDQYAGPQQPSTPPVVPGSPAPSIAAPQMTAPQMAAPQMAAPGTAVPAMAAPAPGTKRVGVLGWIALGVTAVGAIVSWIPPIMLFGWILLGIGFVLSIVSLFLRGAKWPGIVGIALSIVAGIVSGIVLFTVFLGYASTHPDEFDGSAPAASDAATDPGTTITDAADRPSAQEVADGFLVIMDAAGAGGQYTDDEALCIGQHLVDSEVSTESLINVADGRDIQSDETERQLVVQTTMEAVTACKTAP